MKILYATDHTSYLVDGNVYVSSRIYPILQRYSKAFGEIILYSRFSVVVEPPKDAICPDYIKGYVKAKGLKYTLLNRDKDLEKAITSSQLVVGRVPAIPAYKALDYARKIGIPCLTESMGCAWDAYWNHGLAGKIIAPYMFLKMRNLVKHADYASYVTSDFLQKRYPRTKSSVAASNVLIETCDEDILRKRLSKIESMDRKNLSIMTTAAVNVKYKGQQYVIKAIPQLNKYGVRVKYYIVGDGDSSYLQALAKKYNVQDQVVFTGRKSLDEVFSLLDDIDIYAQPSLQEGLPRSVIEAMSRGCIAVGAQTAGIPELIQKEYVVKRKSVSDIVRVLMEISNSTTDILKKIATENFNKTKEFQKDVLERKRAKYYAFVKAEIENRN